MSVLMIRADDSVLKEVITFISKKNQCEIVNLSDLSNIITFSNLGIYLQERIVYLNHTIVPMTHHEFLTLKYFAQHPGWVFSKEQIYEAVYGNEATGDIDNIIYCLIRSLRNKLEQDSQHPNYIQTVRGVGYKFVNPEE